MSTYYKYQNPSEIGAAPTLDWGSVISNVNENLQRQEQQRYENREADKQLANDVLTEINKISQSSDPTLGALVQNHAADIKFNMFNRLKLVQEGKDSRSNYKIFKQNTSASIGSLDTFVKNWEPTYKAMSELRAKGLTTEMANAAQDQYGGFQNFKNKKLIQNQNDGFTYTVDIDPKTNQPRSGAFGILPFETLNNIKNYTDLKVNLTEKAASFTDKMKPFITVEMKNGVRTLEAPNQKDNKNYAEFLDNAFNSIAFNDNVIGDILTNYSDWKPNLTDYKKSSPTDRVVAGRIEGGNIISDITPAMREEAKAIFEKQLLSQVKYEETPRAEFAPVRGGGGGGGTTKPPKYTPTVSDISRMNYKGTNNLLGVALNVDGVIIPKGKGIEDRIDALSYEKDPKSKKMLVRMKVTKISGTETDEVTTGDETGGGTVKVGEGKKNISENTRLLNNQENYPAMSVYIRQVPYPGKDRNFRSVEEAERYFNNEYTRVKGSGGGQGGGTQTKTVIKRSDLAAKAAAAGYSAIEYEKLLKQKGVKIQ
jgi:hypothetical protein